ncbi:transposase family protein, partial [Deltaproteobacteria bacterium TL4]
MSYFNKLRTQKPEKFTRETGIPLKKFKKLRKAVTNHLTAARQNNPLQQRGCKSEISLEDKLLLTLFYLRHYPTFFMLGKQFGVSESYACKIFHHYSDILVNRDGSVPYWLKESWR